MPLNADVPRLRELRDRLWRRGIRDLVPANTDDVCLLIDALIGPEPASPDGAAEREAVGRWRKKPVVVDALRWMGDNGGDMSAFMGAKYQVADRGRLRINTLEGDLFADPGNWIIKGVKGEFYPCRADIFDQTYEPVAPRPGEAPAAGDAEARLAATGEAFRRWAREQSVDPTDDDLMHAFIAGTEHAALAARPAAAVTDAMVAPTHRHRKRGTVYHVVDVATLQTDQPIGDDTALQIYEGHDGRWWARPVDEFNDGRFERLAAGGAS